MKAALLIPCLALYACTPEQRASPWCPARVGVSLGVNQQFAGTQGTGVGVAVIPQWDIKPAPTRPQGPYGVPGPVPPLFAP